MPTGYTADVGDGKLTDFRTFALRCARAFGATIAQREEAMDVLPKHREESPYDRQELEKAHDEVKHLTRVGATEADLAAKADWRRAHESWEESRRDRAEKRDRYERMLADVRAWTPPTKEHAELKRFMVQQLEESIKCDCGGDELWKEPQLKSGAEWRADKLRRARDNVTHYSKMVREEAHRVDAANAWIDALYESLNGSASHV